MSGYVWPLNTQDVQCGYIRGQIRDGHGVDHDQFIPEVEAEFNAWLKQVRAEAWDDGYSSCNEYQNAYVPAPRLNPYRKEAD